MHRQQPDWQTLPPTEKQLAFLSTWCDWLDGVPATRGECAKIISDTIDTWQENAYVATYRPQHREYDNDDMDPDNPFGNDNWMFE